MFLETYIFNSRFLKSSSYAVLSVSIVSVAQNASGFGVNLNNEQMAPHKAASRGVLSSSFKQEKLKTDNVNSVDEAKKREEFGEVTDNKLQEKK